MMFAARAKEATRPLPPIDTLPRTRVQTATFATG